jgi:hypothetical protein
VSDAHRAHLRISELFDCTGVVAQACDLRVGFGELAAQKVHLGGTLRLHRCVLGRRGATVRATSRQLHDAHGRGISEFRRLRLGGRSTRCQGTLHDRPVELKRGGVLHRCDAQVADPVVPGDNARAHDLSTPSQITKLRKHRRRQYPPRVPKRAQGLHAALLQKGIIRRSGWPDSISPASTNTNIHSGDP